MVARPTPSLNLVGHDGKVSQTALEPDEYEAWLDLRDVLEERDREYWETNGDEGDEE